VLHFFLRIPALCHWQQVLPGVDLDLPVPHPESCPGLLSALVLVSLLVMVSHDAAELIFWIGEQGFSVSA